MLKEVGCERNEVAERWWLTTLVGWKADEMMAEELVRHREVV